MLDAPSVSESDTIEAAKWFHKAADLGNVEAQYYLATAYSEGKGVRKDSQEEVKWLRIAAENGHAEAQFNLARLLHRAAASGVMHNKLSEARALELFGESFDFYLKAAEQGHKEAIEVIKRNSR